MRSHSLRLLSGFGLALLLTGCGWVWQGESQRDGPRRIYLYQVQSGDTLYAIARRHRLNPQDLQRWNQIDRPEQMKVGRFLVLNPPGGGSASRRPESKPGDPPREPTSSPTDPPAHPFDWKWPAQGEVIRSYATDSGGKSGIQIGGTEGQPVRAAASGEVVYSGSGLRGYGNLVIIMHDERYLSAYGYNRRVMVAEGERVSGGDQIAEMGRASGAERASLHFEIRIDGNAVDPQSLLPQRS